MYPKNTINKLFTSGCRLTNDQINHFISRSAVLKFYFFYLVFQGHTLKFYCEFNTDLGEDLMSDDGEAEKAAPEMVHIVNVSVMDTPGKDKEKTIYCAETENMDSVSLHSWLIGQSIEGSH